MDLRKLPSYENESRGYIGWNPFADYMCNGGNWSSRLEYKSWQSFIDEFENADDDMNVIINFYFDQREYDEDDNKIPLEDRITHLNMWLLHPRKGTSRGVYIAEVTEGDLPQIKAYMSRQFKTIRNWFSWVNG